MIEGCENTKHVESLIWIHLDVTAISNKYTQCRRRSLILLEAIPLGALWAPIGPSWAARLWTLTGRLWTLSWAASGPLGRHGPRLRPLMLKMISFENIGVDLNCCLT